LIRTKQKPEVVKVDEENQDALLKFVREYPNERYLGSDPPCIENVIAAGVRGRGQLVGLAVYLTSARRVPPDDVLQQLLELNEKKNQPKFRKRELKKIVKNVADQGGAPICNAFEALCGPQACALRGPFYRCWDCKTLVSSKDPVRCPRCGRMILYKPRSERAKLVRAI
jgi:DNA-directed RNA polymerase subunit RPC12/RpoP